MVLMEVKSQGPDSLKEWFRSVARRPILIASFILLAIQIIFAAYQDMQERDRLKESAGNLASIFSLAIFQSNRILVEKVGALAVGEMGAKKVMICSKGQVVFSSAATEDEKCPPTTEWFHQVYFVPMASAPNFDLFFVFPRFPRLSESIAIIFGFSILFAPVYIVLVRIRRRVETDIVKPLAKGVEDILVSDNEYDHKVVFKIRELEDLFEAYVRKTVSIKQLVEAKLSLDKEAAVGRVIRQLSHDMRAPLGTFEGLLELNDSMPIGGYRSKIRESLYRLHAMIESLRHSETELLIRPTRCLVNFRVGLENLAHKASMNNIIFKPERLTAFDGFVDLPKFERAWINLVSNAIEAAQTTVKLEVVFDNEDVIVLIADDGKGVAEDFLPRLFQRGATFGKEGGTGLGLAYAQQVCRGHGGDVSYFRENGWTIFKMFLPGVLYENPLMETQRATESAGQERRQIVSLSLSSPLLAQALLLKLNSMVSQRHEFLLDRDDIADIVVSNNRVYGDQLLTEGRQSIVFDDDTSDEEILRRTPLKLGLGGLSDVSIKK